MTDLLLQENGDFLLLENSDKIILEQSIPTPPVTTTTPRRRAAWFGIPEMRQKILEPKKKIYLNEVVANLRNG